MRGKEERKKLKKKTLVVKVQEPSTRAFLDLKGQKLVEAGFYKREKKRDTNQQLIETLKV